MSKRTWIVVTLALFGGLLLSACGGGLPELTAIPTLAPRDATPALADALQTPPAPEEEGAGEEAGPPVEMVSLEEAKPIFAESCASCHGQDGVGGTVGPDLANSENVAAMAHDELFGIIAEGVQGSAMVGYAGQYTNAEINGLVALIQSWNGEAPPPEPEEEAAEPPETEEAPPTEAAEEPTEAPAGAAALFEMHCQSCHGENGQNALVGPDLANSDSIQAMDAEALHAIIAEGVEGTAMASFAGVLTEGEIGSLVTLMQSWQTAEAPAEATEETTEEPTEEAAEAPAEGFDVEAAFASSCQACHGENGVGGTVGPDLANSDAIAQMSTEDIHTILSEGVSGTAMVGYADQFSEAQIDAFVELIESWQE